MLLHAMIQIWDQMEVIGKKMFTSDLVWAIVLSFQNYLVVGLTMIAAVATRDCTTLFGECFVPGCRHCFDP